MLDAAVFVSSADWHIYTSLSSEEVQQPVVPDEGREQFHGSWAPDDVQPFFHAFGRFALSLVDEFVGFRSVSRVDVHASGIFYFVQGRMSAHVSQKIGYVIFSLNRDSAFPKGSSSVRVCRNTGFWLLCGYLFGRRAYRSDNANSNKLLNTCRMSVSESFSLFSKKRKTYSSSL